MNPKRKKIIILLSVIVPLVVASLFGIRIDTDIDFSFLPRVYAILNFSTFIILVLAFVAIKRKKIIYHEKLVKTALVTTTLFLVLYILYHITSDSTIYGGTGALKYIYYFILITHISLSVLVIPLVLISLGWAMDENFKRHKKIARIAMPIWMYVAISGVMVYLLISPYYA
jgi:putative membrane protein